MVRGNTKLPKAMEEITPATRSRSTGNIMLNRSAGKMPRRADLSIESG